MSNTRNGVLTLIVLWSPSLVALTGCSRIEVRTRINVHTTNYLSSDIAFPAPGEQTKIRVIAKADPDEPLLEAEVRRKLEFMIRNRGYSIGSEADANYILLAFFSIDSGSTATGVRPIYHSGGPVTTNVYTSAGQWGTATTYLPGNTSFVPYSNTYFTRYLGLDILERERWVANSGEDSEIGTIWRGTTLSQGNSSDLRSIIDYLIIASFEYFGADSGKQVRSTFYENDSRVRLLRSETSDRGADPSQ